MKKKLSHPPAYPIESVDKALQLILMLRKATTIRLTEASGALGVAPSTAHRLLAMLEYRGFVQRDPLSRAYAAGPVLLDVGFGVAKDIDLRAVLRPCMERIAAETGETVSLVVLQGAAALHVEVIESNRLLRVSTPRGQVFPAHATAGGKVLLAQLKPQDLRKLYPEPRLPGRTPRTIVERTELERQLADIRTRGYAINLEESEPSVNAVAVAIGGRTTAARGAITVAGPGSRMKESILPATAQAIRRMTEEARAQLG